MNTQLPAPPATAALECHAAHVAAFLAAYAEAERKINDGAASAIVDEPGVHVMRRRYMCPTPCTLGTAAELFHAHLRQTLYRNERVWRDGVSIEVMDPANNRGCTFRVHKMVSAAEFDARTLYEFWLYYDVVLAPAAASSASVLGHDFQLVPPGETPPPAADAAAECYATFLASSKQTRDTAALVVALLARVARANVLLISRTARQSEEMAALVTGASLGNMDVLGCSASRLTLKGASADDLRVCVFSSNSDMATIIGLQTVIIYQDDARATSEIDATYAIMKVPGTLAAPASKPAAAAATTPTAPDGRAELDDRFVAATERILARGTARIELVDRRGTPATAVLRGADGTGEPSLEAAAASAAAYLCFDYDRIAATREDGAATPIILVAAAVTPPAAAAAGWAWRVAYNAAAVRPDLHEAAAALIAPKPSELALHTVLSWRCTAMAASGSPLCAAAKLLADVPLGQRPHATECNVTIVCRRRAHNIADDCARGGAPPPEIETLANAVFCKALLRGATAIYVRNVTYVDCELVASVLFARVD